MHEHIKLEVEEGVYTLIFDRNRSSANVFDRATLDALNQHLDTLYGDTRMRGLILRSAKPKIFIAGADLHELLAEDITEDALREMVRKGQQTFQRIADLKVPTVAVIHGACLGGGFEVCLACDYRIASDERATRIGLPETSLGILPAWGGCARLPRLIGLPRALDAILSGKRMPARLARKRGLVDGVVPREHFTRMALGKIAQGKPERPGHRLTNNRFVARIIAGRVRPTVLKKTQGHYPAVTRALEVITEGAHGSLDEAFKLEEQATVDLVNTDVCRNLVRVFFLQERAKKLWVKDDLFKHPETKQVTVIGAGVMGAGIAQWVASRGTQVILRDIGEEQVGKGLATISRAFQQGVKRHLFTKVTARQGMDRIVPAATEVPIQRAGFIIEAAVESLDIKKQIFKRLDERAGEEAVLATNTSALSINEIASATTRPERVVGIHFFNPIHRMQLVEVVVGDQTDERIADRAVKFVQQMGKLPVVVKDRPGFVVNRILMPYLIEAGILFESGIPAASIDQAMLTFGMPMGPLRLIDEVGVDVAEHVASFLASQYGERMPTSALLGKMKQAGHLGRKAGKGFYEYGRGRGDPAPNGALSQWVVGAAPGEVRPEDLARRMTLLMVNEAARCLEEEVVKEPEDIDFAMIMGTGFAPFRGGPLRYADTEGISNIVDGLMQLKDQVDDRFAASERLQAMSTGGASFYK